MVLRTRAATWRNSAGLRKSVVRVEAEDWARVRAPRIFASFPAFFVMNWRTQEIRRAAIFYKRRTIARYSGEGRSASIDRGKSSCGIVLKGADRNLIQKFLAFLRLRESRKVARGRTLLSESTGSRSDQG